MSYSLSPDEPVDASVRRVGVRLVAHAIRTLRDEEGHSAHHQVRKCCKKVRALLRLVRKPLGDQFKAENHWYRDFARQLAGVRDAQAVVESWSDLQRHTVIALSDDRQENIGALLEQRRDAVAARRAPAADELIAGLRAARRRVHDWELDRDGFDALAGGLARAYRRAQELMLEARAGASGAGAPDPRTLHEWRKRAKDHWYHMRLLERFPGGDLRGRIDSLRELTDDLGRHHDLQTLREVLGEIDLGRGELAALAPSFQARGIDLAESSFWQGAALFPMAPEVFIADLRARRDPWARGATIPG